MKKSVKRLWARGIVANFLTGLFVVLPLVLTVGIMAWVGGILSNIVGPETAVGNVLKALGELFKIDHATMAMVIGWIIVVVAIWFIGVFFRSFARHRLDDFFNDVLSRIPLFNHIYKPVSQVVGLLKKSDNDQMKGMSVVYCLFGEKGSGGFLGLLATNEIFKLGDKDSKLIYVPTSPVPMSGGLIFVPAEAIQPVDMTVDDLMKIYFSLGVLSSEVVPEQYKKAKK